MLNLQVGGSLVVTVVQGRNLQVGTAASTFVRLRLAPEGVTTCTESLEEGAEGKHPLWNQTRVLTVKDVASSRLLIDVNESNGTSVGDFSVAVFTLVAAAQMQERSVAKNAMLSRLSSVAKAEHATVSRSKISRSERREFADEKKRQQDKLENEEAIAEGEAAQSYGESDSGFESWFFIHGVSPERPIVGEVRLWVRFFSDEKLQEKSSSSVIKVAVGWFLFSELTRKHTCILLRVL